MGNFVRILARFAAMSHHDCQDKKVRGKYFRDGLRRLVFAYDHAVRNLWGKLGIYLHHPLEWNSLFQSM